MTITLTGEITRRERCALQTLIGITDRVGPLPYSVLVSGGALPGGCLLSLSRRGYAERVTEGWQPTAAGRAEWQRLQAARAAALAVS